ncbi:hypothetical protein MIND_00453900 [Mycena indigotica]|uniref:DnaJ homolog 1, mitochondrial n=1 Tax=Mycena indigotica TaxID=2126181 RepID=A0A8H6SZ97_9AGAR|nr:uncharacterized protein MIND_00453900 [Mycena indigotica]KAF7306625.1 hypothetical protein MIND_00453900 [Mycena indigotica]
MPPTNWPPTLQYLTACKYHLSVNASTHKFIARGQPDASIDGGKPSKVLIQPIKNTSHPAFGQLGLFAAKKIPPKRHIVDYIGEVHCDERPDSDYDLSLYRSNEIAVGVDASRMGNEARFVNDFRGIDDRPNAVFVEYRTSTGELRVKIESSRAIKAGEELARKHHPDTSTDKGAQDKFVEIQSAYDILKDDEKRKVYDQFGSTSQEPGFDPNAFSGFGGGNFSGFHNFGASFSRGETADLFSQLFQGLGGSSRSGFQSSRGSDLEASVRITFLEACKGTSRKINITPVVDCTPCSGNGLKPGAKRTTCTTCKGSGTRTFVIDSGFQMASTCNTCSGTGSTVPHNSECSHCGGVGKVRTKSTVQVDIMAGVEDGVTLRLPRRGDAPISGKGSPGDLLVRIHVTASKDFSRQGNNLYHKTRIPMHTALLGGKVRVPTLDGEVDVRLPGGTQQDEEMVLKGRGVSSPHGGVTGDLFVSFSVQLPRSLTNRQRELLQMYADDVEGRQPGVKSDEGTSTNDNEVTDTSQNRAVEEETSQKSNEKRRATATG